MVLRVHKYADGGKIVKDHDVVPPTYMGAVADRVKGVFGFGPNASPKKKQGVSKAADEIKNTREQQMKDLGL